MIFLLYTLVCSTHNCGSDTLEVYTYNSIHLFSCLKTFYGPCNVVVASLKLVPRLKRRQAFLSSFFFALRAQRFLTKANAVMESEFPNFNESTVKLQVETQIETCFCLQLYGRFIEVWEFRLHNSICFLLRLCAHRLLTKANAVILALDML